VIDAAAGMVEALLHTNPAACVIATSREPLRAQGERLYRVPPLAVPSDDTQTLEDALQQGAVALFVAWVQATDPHFSPDRRTAAAIAAICRRLDGIPLALELAAARASTLGVQELASRLDDRFSLLTEGLRTALRRTLRATLDWSYELLSNPSGRAAPAVDLRRGFYLGSGECGYRGVGSRRRCRKPGRQVARYGGCRRRHGPLSLLDTTRAYSRKKLAEHGELEQAARKHAEYYLDLCRQAEAEWETRPAAEWLAGYGRQLGNVRAALDWAFSPRGDASIGVALTAAAVPLWCQLSLLDECRRRVEEALFRVAPGSNRDVRCQMQLETALGLSLFHTKVLRARPARPGCELSRSQTVS
jgi:predicted ATPase